ncbi:DUF6198 family protein [Blautia schinkii]|nr:DUF6198 family protein [Blautia schinkii]
MNIVQKFLRFTFYIMGAVLLAIGITLSTKTGLGVSPIISVPFSIASIWNLNFAAMTFIVYTLLVGIQILLKSPHFAPIDLLQIPFSLVFSFFLNIFEKLFRMEFIHLWQNLILLLIAIILTGIGAAVMVDMKLTPNPADGLAATVGEVTRKGMGFGKNLIDFSSVALSCMIGLVFSQKLEGIGVGTIIAMIGVGRTIALFNHFFKEKIVFIAGLQEFRCTSSSLLHP